jgi:ABC-2 type transport system permease protein/lipopolysaccharide transport system permease protein
MNQESNDLQGFWLVEQMKDGLTRENFSRAVGDIVGGWRSRRLWIMIGIQDIQKRYRRSIIGPFWITISMGVMIAALGLLYGAIFRQPLDVYLPYLAAGFVCWGLISSLALEGTAAFTANEGYIKQLSAPLSIHVYSVVWRNLVIFLHNVWIYFIVALWFGKAPGWTVFWAFPAFAVLLLNGLWIGILLGLFSTRFRDVPQIVASVVQVMFFLTPVIWTTDMLPGRALILDLNPFYYFLELVRAPLLGYLPSAQVVAGAVVITALGWVFALMFYTIYRWRLAYWV